MNKIKTLMTLALLFIALPVFATNVLQIGKVKHDIDSTNYVWVTVGALMDKETKAVCVTAVVTRNSGGAGTAIECYKVNNPGTFELTEVESLTHDTGKGGHAFQTNFKVRDTVNETSCFGVVMTRSGDGDKGAGASVSLSCVK